MALQAVRGSRSSALRARSEPDPQRGTRAGGNRRAAAETPVLAAVVASRP
jgi:hypothetical protein